jgi:phosphatidylglycerol---prolipoprotein diacylglyceryl transferase
MLPLAAIPFPAISPEIFSVGPFELPWFTLGPFALRWYALAYIVGLVLGWRYCVAMAKRPGAALNQRQLDDFLLWVTLGVVLGGRLGYVLFYQPGYYLQHPFEIVAMWRGGMSFHGGLLGVVVAIVLFARRHAKPVLGVSDAIAGSIPIGLFFGRIANFINGELYGRVTDVPWAMVFPHTDPALPRHPSQLYEAVLEGVVLFIVLYVMEQRGARARPGLLTGTFLIGYALSRIVVEFFREPDRFLGLLAFGSTMGQLLSLPLAAFGLYLVLRARPAAPAKPG